MTAAYEAGLSVFPLGRNKRPAVREWRPYMEHRPELDEFKIWMASDFSGYAVVMGGPERLLAIDLERDFHQDHYDGFLQRLIDDELYYEWLNMCLGYCVETPSGGLHVVIHLMGDGPMPGNEKLASDRGGKCLAETRAQGGYIVGYGSNGEVHPSGGQWRLDAGGYDAIAWTEMETWLAIKAVLVSFDESTPPPVDGGRLPAGVLAAPPAGGVSLAELERGSSYLNEARAAMPTMASVLTTHGWVFSHSDADYEYWVRPGKNPRLGHSATINQAGRLFVFSSNAHPVPPSPGRQTYSVIDVLSFYEGVSGGDIVRSYRPNSPGPTAPAQPPPELVLPADFWQATPLLAHIRQAAWARRVSPDTLYEAVKALYAASIPWNFRLPSDGTLDYVGLMVGNSGSGKTRSKKAAMALLPPELHQLDGVRLSMPAPSSGEGIVESYIKRQAGKQVGLEYRGLGFYTDEGQQFFSVLDRSGNTLAEVAKSAWMGEMTGNVAATQERHRLLSPGEVRLSMLIGIQIDVAAQFLSASHTNGGLPQRANWAWAYHPGRVPASDTDWPGPLDVAIYDRMRWGGGDTQHLLHTLTLESSVERDVRERQDARADSPDTGLLDAHAEYAILKTAGVLALMHGDFEVSSAFWELACLDWNLTVAVRNEVSRRAQATVVDRDVALGRAQAARNLASVDVYLERAIDSLVRKVKSSDAPISASQAKDHLRSYAKRYKLAYTEIVDAAAARGWVVIHRDGAGVTIGGVRGS